MAQEATGAGQDPQTQPGETVKAPVRFKGEPLVALIGSIVVVVVFDCCLGLCISGLGVNAVIGLIGATVTGLRWKHYVDTENRWNKELGYTGLDRVHIDKVEMHQMMAAFFVCCGGAAIGLLEFAAAFVVHVIPTR